MLLLPICGWAQEEEARSRSTNPFVNEVGFNAGATTGLGLSYRHWFDRAGIQITAMPYKLENEALISGGLTAMLSLHNARYVRIFGYWGNHLWYRSWRHTDYNTGATKTDTDTRYNTGVGFGFSLGRVVAFNISIGYGAYNVLGGWDALSLLPTGEVGLYWRF